MQHGKLSPDVTKSSRRAQDSQHQRAGRGPRVERFAVRHAHHAQRAFKQANNASRSAVDRAKRSGFVTISVVAFADQSSAASRRPRRAAEDRRSLNSFSHPAERRSLS